MLYRNTAGYFDASMVVISNGTALTAGSVRCFVQRSSDDYWLKADTTWASGKPTGADIPTMTHVSGGLWKLAHTPADVNDTYLVNCIDAGETCFPDNYESTILPGPSLSGPYRVSVQFYITATTTPIADVSFDVYNSTQTLKLNGLAISSDSLGQASFLRDNGTYKIRAIKAGTTIAVATVVVASADTSITVYGDTIALPSPSAPGMQILFGNVRRLNWAVATGEVIKAVISANEQLVSGALMQTLKLTTTVDANSQFYFEVPCNTKIRIETPHHGNHEFTTDGTAGTKDIADYLFGG